MCMGIGQATAQGVPWFGNSRGVAILECGEIASGSQEAEDRPVPGHNHSLSAALTHAGLSAPRNTKFTQAQNAALPQPHRLIATVVLALHPQAPRAMEKVVGCSRGLPFTGWSLEPSDETQMSRGQECCFPGEVPCHSPADPKGR